MKILSSINNLTSKLRTPNIISPYQETRRIHFYTKVFVMKERGGSQASLCVYTSLCQHMDKTSDWSMRNRQTIVKEI